MSHVSTRMEIQGIASLPSSFRYLTVLAAAVMGTKRWFSALSVFFMLANSQTIGCYSEELLETFLINKSYRNSPFLESNRLKRELNQLDEYLGNLKVYDTGGMLPDVNDAAETRNGKHVGLTEENIPVRVTVIPVPAVPMMSLCRDLQVDLGRGVADFCNCSVMNARPIGVCRHCVAPFNETMHVYQQLMEASEKNVKCKDVLFGKDKLEIVETMYQNVINLWYQGNCYSCYEGKDGVYDLSALSNQTLYFFQALKNVTKCFENIRSASEKANDTSNNGTCVQCRAVYEHLAAVYSDIVKDQIDNQPTEEVCADIADAMNVTHHLWNNQFRCKVFGTDVGYGMVVLTVSLSSLPILFYLAAKILSNVETILLVLPKRRAVAQDSARMQM